MFEVKRFPGQPQMKCVCRESSLWEGKLYPNFGKRFLDFLLSVPALILLSPLYVLLWLLIRRRMGSPVLFRQGRPGLHGKAFSLLKSRTMEDMRFAKGAFGA